MVQTVLNRVAGDEDAYVHAPGGDADALYDVNRRALSGMLAAARGPSTWSAEEMPSTLEERLHSLVEEYVPDTEDGRKTAIRHSLARRLLDDPVVYIDELTEDARGYFLNQRGAIALRLAEATGLMPEQRAEGLAMVDAEGELTDIAMPAEGTDAHVTLLVAELLSSEQRQTPRSRRESRFSMQRIASHLAEAKDRYGKYWRRSAREPGSEQELSEMAVNRLQMLRLVQMDGDWIIPLPALARFCLGDTEVKSAATNRSNGAQDGAQANLL
jgi:uncharacterized protein (TIGR02678 family)